MVLEAVRHDGAGAFLERAEARLLEQEDRNNLILSLAYARANSGTFEPEEVAPVLVREVSNVYGCAFCVLFTDLSNPTSNTIYQRPGYRPLCDLSDVGISEGERQ